MSNQIPVSEPEKRILETIRTELFPITKRLKDLLVRIRASKIFFQIYSPLLAELEKEYFQVSSEFFVVDRKLTTPEILFTGLSNDEQNIKAYFMFQGAFKQNLEEAVNYIEIIDRTLDRKRDIIQNSRTLIVAIIAIGISIFTLWASIRLAESQIDVARDQISIQNGDSLYQKLRDDRLEARDIQWRKEDLQFQERLPKGY